jgi:protein ImuB
VAGELTLELLLEDETSHRRLFRLPDPTGDPEILFRALHTHLETLRTDSAITGVRLTASPTRPLARQREIFESGLRDPHGFSETLARVEAVVGAGSVGTPYPEPVHRPDSFVMEKPAPAVAAMPAAAILPPLGPALRRFRPPVEASVECDGASPESVRCAVAEGRVRCSRGPWRLSGEWWKPERWGREEWDVELEAGGLFRLGRTAGRWWVEGMYD